MGCGQKKFFFAVQAAAFLRQMEQRPITDLKDLTEHL
jgi:hypothetical protein